MRAVVQRVSSASVEVAGRIVGRIGPGVVLLLGIERGDGEPDVRAMVDKVTNMRLFPDGSGSFERSLGEVGGSVLVVSQFTLLSDVRRGRRPSFTQAAPPEMAAPLVERAVALFRDEGLPTETGVFGASMEVELVNDGPVTIIIETAQGRVR